MLNLMSVVMTYVHSPALRGRYREIQQAWYLVLAQANKEEVNVISFTTGTAMECLLI